jgi:hypothetical protein
MKNKDQSAQPGRSEAPKSTSWLEGLQNVTRDVLFAVTATRIRCAFHVTITAGPAKSIQK